MRRKYLATSESPCFISMADLTNLTKSRTLINWADATIAQQTKMHARSVFIGYFPCDFISLSSMADISARSVW